MSNDRWGVRKVMAAMAVVLGVVASPCAAATILVVDEGLGTGPAVGAQANQYVGVSWTQTGTWTDVVVRAPIWTTSVAHTTGTAWITQDVGQAAQPGAELDSNAVSFTAHPTWTTLFSGLTLGPGTWYVILSVTPSVTDVGYRAWRNGNAAPVTGSGVTYGAVQLTSTAASDPAYPPGSVFFTNYPSLAISVTGNGPFVPLDPSEDTPTVPEPALLVLLGVGLLASGRRAAR